MTRRWILAAAIAVLTAVPAARATAQTIFLDVNGDGRCDSYDVLDASVTSVDVWIDTDHDIDGNSVTCPGHEQLDIYSYSFILRWDRLGTGTLTYGAWTDNLGFPVDAGGMRSGNDMWLARASATPLPPGRYKLGTLDVSVQGTGTLTILGLDPTLDRTAMTSFGSHCEGGDFDNTMKLGSDFTDACGSAPPTGTARNTWEKIQATYR